MDFKLEIAKIVAELMSQDFNKDEIYEYIETPPERGMGDFALPCFKLSKKLRQAAPQIAANLAEKLTDMTKATSTTDTTRAVELPGMTKASSATDTIGGCETSAAATAADAVGIVAADATTAAADAIGVAVADAVGGAAGAGGDNGVASDEPLISRAEAVGGYLNLFLNRSKMAKEVINELLSGGETFGVKQDGHGERIVLEFSSPNIAKPFHIGHMFTTVIGNALKNIYDFLGYETVSVNHLGDWGTQFGKLICAYKHWGDEDALKDDTINELLRVYVMFHKEVKENCSLDGEAREYFKLLEQGEEEVTALWRKFRDFSLNEFDKVYKRLGIRFDSLAGESFYSDKMDSVVDELKSKNLLVESDGAQIVDLSAYNLTPCIILKSDGATIYATRDIAAAIYRKRTYDFFKNLYVVGIPQTLHFKQVFAVLDLLGYEWNRDCVHVGFGLVKFADRQMATREGEVIFLEEVLAEAVNRAAAMMDETRGVDNPEEVAEMVGVGAIIYTFLKNNRDRDIIFSWEDMMDMEGDSGPYVQYTCARAGSVLRKAADAGATDEAPDYSLLTTDEAPDYSLLTTDEAPDYSLLTTDEAPDYSLLTTDEAPDYSLLTTDEAPDYSLLTTDEEFELIDLLNGFGDAVRDAGRRYEPSILTRHIGRTSRAFNKFYNSCKVIGAPPGLRGARLTLCYISRRIISKGLDLLGIKTPEQM